MVTLQRSEYAHHSALSMYDCMDVCYFSFADFDSVRVNPELAGTCTKITIRTYATYVCTVNASQAAIKIRPKYS